MKSFLLIIVVCFVGFIGSYRVHKVGDVLCDDQKCFCNGTMLQKKVHTVDNCGGVTEVGWNADKFKTVCERYSQCYSTCGNYKAECDEKFCVTLRAVCKEQFHGAEFSSCLTNVQYYCDMANWYGFIAYLEVQKEHCTCKDA